jgi:DNA (cytosine-5)-methyltransferase 1
MFNEGRNLKFIDLFAGIGGFHEALKKLSLECVFASEIDEYARKTYLANYQIDLANFNRDLRSISPSEIPDHDILCAGFPCQPFSQAGYKKGFNDGDKSERGNLFFCIVDILEAKKPAAYIIENVRHLLKHDNGCTFKIIYQHLEEVGYTVNYQVLKASDYGLPQHRPRVFIVGFNRELVDAFWAFNFPLPIPLKMTMSDVWEGNCDRDIGFTLRVGGRRSPIDDRRNWDGYKVNGEVVRIQPKQGLKMMGFPDRFQFPVSKTEAMKQLGNSVCVDVVYHVAREVKEYLENNKIKEISGNKELKGTLNKGEWSEFYAFAKISELVTDENKICRIKDYLKAVLLGMFFSKQWDGEYTANGSVLVRKEGDLVLYHVIKDKILKDYLFHNTKLDTPSSTRHRFGTLYKEKNQTLIKLNLQIRFIN